MVRDVAGARSLAEEAVHLATEWGLSVHRIVATIFRAWCDVQDGCVDHGLATLHSALGEYAECGERVSTSTYGAILAEAHLASGDVIGANQVPGAAFSFVAETGERSFEHELHRLRGECLVARAEDRGQKARAAESFERAIAISAEQKALLFELRAATSLLRLRGQPVRERVVRLVDRFAAEDDCADLQAARELLAR